MWQTLRLRLWRSVPAEHFCNISTMGFRDCTVCVWGVDQATRRYNTQRRVALLFPVDVSMRVYVYLSYGIRCLNRAHVILFILLQTFAQSYQRIESFADDRASMWAPCTAYTFKYSDLHILYYTYMRCNHVLQTFRIVHAHCHP